MKSPLETSEGEHVAICEAAIPPLDGHPRSRMSVPEIARRLNIGRLTVYAMLEQGILPGLRLGRRWIVTRHAYERWERTCGTEHHTGFHSPQEVTVLN
jgi:excisionase family DNA binding protein